MRGIDNMFRQLLGVDPAGFVSGLEKMGAMLDELLSMQRTALSDIDKRLTRMEEALGVVKPRQMISASRPSVPANAELRSPLIERHDPGRPNGD